MVLQRLRSLSVRGQLAGMSALILVLVLLILSILLNTLLGAFLIDKEAARLRQLSSSVTAGINQRIGFMPMPNRGPNAPSANRGQQQRENEEIFLAEQVQRINTRDTTAIVLGLDGTSLANSRSADDPTPIAHLDKSILDQAYTSRQEVVTIVPGENERLLVLLKPLLRNGTPVAFLQISTSLGTIDDILATLRLWSALGMLGAVLLGSMLTILITRALLAPLEQVVATSEKIAEGDLSLRLNLPLDSRNEIGKLGTAFDRMVDRLEDSFHAQRQFVADASHELRTPLTALSGLLEMLLMGIDAGDERKTQHILRSMNSEIDRMSRLVGDLLTLSRLDVGTPMLLQRVDLQLLAEEVLQESEALAGEKQVSLYSDGQISVEGDPDRLKQVMLNLITNAIQHTPSAAAGKIAISVKRNADMAILSVADNGDGISADDISHIFERFYRADKSRARRSGGLGLGLAIAHAIVHAHHGSMEVASSPGQGSIFTVYLPLYCDKPSPSPLPATHRAAGSIAGLIKS